MKEKARWIILIVEIIIAVGLIFAFMSYQGAFDETLTDEKRLIAVCDGFSITALIYLCFGALNWVSTTGFFDVFGYAIKKGAHNIIPALFINTTNSYYDYKAEKHAEGKKKPFITTLLIGVVLMIVSVILVVIIG